MKLINKKCPYLHCKKALWEVEVYPWSTRTQVGNRSVINYGKHLLGSIIGVHFAQSKLQAVCLAFHSCCVCGACTALRLSNDVTQHTSCWCIINSNWTLNRNLAQLLATFRLKISYMNKYTACRDRFLSFHWNQKKKRTSRLTIIRHVSFHGWCPLRG